jgi:hypothetical protein
LIIHIDFSMFSTPLTKIFREFYKRRAVLEGETKKNECRVRLGNLHLEIRRETQKVSVRIYEHNGISGERNVLQLTELALWERFCARRLVRRLHNYSRANVRAREMQALHGALLKNTKDI